MAFQKAHTDRHGDEHTEAYHRVGDWHFRELYNGVQITGVIFTYRSEADWRHDQDVAARRAEGDETADKENQHGPIAQDGFSLSIAPDGFQDKSEMNVATTYTLLKRIDKWVDALDV